MPVWVQPVHAPRQGAEISPEPVTEPEPALVTPEESGYRTRDTATERVAVRRAERRASAHRSATCDAPGEARDTFCALCGSRLANLPWSPYPASRERR